MRGSWFDNFERNLAENGWLDNMYRTDLYERAGTDAFDQLRASDPRDIPPTDPIEEALEEDEDEDLAEGEEKDRK